jgi:hypothetical protein
LTIKNGLGDTLGDIFVNRSGHTVSQHLCRLESFAASQMAETKKDVFHFFHSRAENQGCQIFSGTTYQNGKKYTKLPQNIQNVHKTDQMSVK